MPNNVIAKGKYVFPQSDPLLTVQNFIFLRENGKKYLLLKWKNQRGEVLNGLKFTVVLYDAAGTAIGKRELVFEDLQAQPKAAFILDCKIEVDEDCVDFKAVLDCSRYGNYTYSVEKGGVVANYDSGPRLQSVSRLPDENRPAGTQFDVSVKKPVFPIWVRVLFCVLMAGLIAFTCWRMSDFKKNATSFLKGGVLYTYVYNAEAERRELHVTGFHGTGKNLTIYDTLDGLPVTRIKDGAFQNNYVLETVTLKGSLEIGTRAFFACQRLKEINLDNVTVIEREAFANCTGLSSITAYRLTELGSRAFSDCASLTSIIIHNADTSLELDSMAFSGCHQLREVKIDQYIEYPDYPAIFPESYNMQALELKNFPSSEDGKVFTVSDLLGGNRVWPPLKRLKIGYIDSIPDRFCFNMQLERVEILEMREPIVGERAFSSCYNLQDLVLPRIKRIGIEAFSSTAITSFDGTELETLGQGAFAGCASLETFEFGSHLTRIEERTFSDCSSLASVSIPSNMEYIASEAFSGCESLKELSVPFLGHTRELDGQLVEIFGYGVPSSLKTVTITEPLNTIGHDAFSGCEYIESIVLKGPVTSIGENAFNYCRSLSQFNLSEGLTSVGSSAFNYCTSLNEIVLPASLTSIGTEAFANCYHLYEVWNNSRIDLSGDPSRVGQVTRYALKVYGAGEVEVPKVRKDGYRFALIDSIWYMVDYPRDAVALNLPLFFEYDGIVNSYTLPQYLFFENTTLQSVTVPQSVADIGVNAFSGCWNLQKVFIAGDSPVTELREGVFSNCSSLKDVSLPVGLETIGASAFSGCYALENIVLPRSLKSIGEMAFIDCENLKTVYNLSRLPLAKGGKNYGHVAYYAENVYTSLEGDQDDAPGA